MVPGKKIENFQTTALDAKPLKVLIYRIKGTKWLTVLPVRVTYKTPLN